MTRLKLCAAATFIIVSATTLAAQAVDSDGPQWPNVQFDGPRVNSRPAFVDPKQVEDRILGRKPDVVVPKSRDTARSNSVPRPAAAVNPVADGLDANASARWPTLPPQKQPSPFAFETGARYWFSGGTMRFGFANGSPLFGSPTSTLDWSGLSAHSGEVFARLDHVPSGVFVKGVVGHGSIRSGHIDDRDFLAGQFKFSDTTSDVTGGAFSFAMFDVGWAFFPSPEIRLGVFAGYHYWRESVTANGVLCNQASVPGCAVGTAVVGFDIPALRYEPTWHALRIGIEGKVWIDNRWSVNGEIAGVPYASLQNKDSHLLRQSFADLGPAPNIITDSKYAYGVEAEVLMNYAVTPNIEIGGGLRYWGAGLAERRCPFRTGLLDRHQFAEQFRSAAVWRPGARQRQILNAGGQPPRIAGMHSVALHERHERHERPARRSPENRSRAAQSDRWRRRRQRG